MGPSIKGKQIYTMTFINVIKQYNNLSYDHNSKISVITVKPIRMNFHITI